MTTSARTAETNAADALAQLLTYLGDTDNLAHWVTEFEDSFPSPIVKVETLPPGIFWSKLYPHPFAKVTFEDGSVLHLTVTQVKESNR